MRRPSGSVGAHRFSFQRGYRFGTILVNLESHRVVDLLPDRQAETAAQWMRHQTELAVVSRDRGGEYASAACEGAPQAIQCADWFHIVKNLTEATQVLLARCQAGISTSLQTEAFQQDHTLHRPKGAMRVETALLELCGHNRPRVTSLLWGDEG